MKDLLLHPSTRQQLSSLLDTPPHAIVLGGKVGSGKVTIARALSASLLGVAPEKLDNHPYFTVIDPKVAIITIDEVRELQQFLKLRVPYTSDQKIKRIVMIIQAERMRTEAQNALLKTLEEPPTDTLIVLTSDHPERLLSTITSRAQSIAVLPVDATQARSYFAGANPAVFTRAYALSGGQAGLLYALLNETDHPLVKDVETAKALLAKTPAERLLEVDELAKDKQAVFQLLEALLRLTRAGLHAASSKQATPAVRAWHTRHEAVLESTEYLRKNANTKLVLDNLFLNI